MDVEDGADVMRIHPVLVLALAALAAPLRTSGAQAGGEPSACVNATGPDTSRAPTPAAATTAQPADTTHVALRILASVSASELRFVGSPKVCVRLTGDARLDSLHVLARRNLATPVVSGTTYRDVYVAVEILGRLNAECISARITGAPRDSSATARCASLEARTGPPGPP